MLTQDMSITIAALNLFDVDCSAEDAHLTSDKQQQMLSARIMFMYIMGRADALRIIMHVFLYTVMYHSEPDRGRIDTARKRNF
jgi:hypothetical protein